MSHENLIVNSSRRDFMGDLDPDNVYIPGRTAVLGINVPDTQIVLPDMPGLRRYVSDLEIIIGEFRMAPPRAIFIPDAHYLLDISIDMHLSELTRRLARSVSYSVQPYSNTPELRTWVEKARNQGYGLDIEMPEQVFFADLTHPQHRAGWSRNVNKPDRPSFPERWEIPYPVSYWGVGLDDLKLSYNLVTQRTGEPQAVLKPVFSAGGSTIQLVSSLPEVEEYYTGMKESGALFIEGKENPIEVQEFLRIKRLYSYQYSGINLITPGGISRQYVSRNAWKGNLFNSFENNLTMQAFDFHKRFVTGMETERPNEKLGEGGKDLAELEGGSLIVVEHNGARVTGAHGPIRFSEIMGVVNKPFMAKMVDGVPQGSLLEAWNILKGKDIGFDVYTKRGVFPLAWFEGCVSLFATNGDTSGTESVYDEALEILIKEGAVR